MHLAWRKRVDSLTHTRMHTHHLTHVYTWAHVCIPLPIPLPSPLRHPHHTHQCQEVLPQFLDGDHGLHPKLAALTVHKGCRHFGPLHRYTEAALEQLHVCGGEGGGSSINKLNISTLSHILYCTYSITSLLAHNK